LNKKINEKKKRPFTTNWYLYKAYFSQESRCKRNEL